VVIADISTIVLPGRGTTDSGIGSVCEQLRIQLSMIRSVASDLEGIDCKGHLKRLNRVKRIRRAYSIFGQDLFMEHYVGSM